MLVAKTVIRFPSMSGIRSCAPFEGSGQRTHEAIAGSELVVVNGGPHGVNISHAAEFNQELISFLSR